jgi:hypothetical protein
LFPERDDQLPSALHGFETVACEGSNLTNSIQAKIGQFSLLHVAPDVFDRVEFRSVRWQTLKHDMAVNDKMQALRSIKETAATPVCPLNPYIRHKHNPLAEKAFCVCQMYAVLHYFLRTESRKESNGGEMGRICGGLWVAWHTQNGPKPRVACGKRRNGKAD